MSNVICKCAKRKSNAISIKSIKDVLSKSSLEHLRMSKFIAYSRCFLFDHQVLSRFKSSWLAGCLVSLPRPPILVSCMLFFGFGLPWFDDECVIVEFVKQFVLSFFSLVENDEYTCSFNQNFKICSALRDRWYSLWSVCQVQVRQAFSKNGEVQ